MPGVLVDGPRPSKRKRDDDGGRHLSRKAPKSARDSDEVDLHANILLLEGEILESRTSYNNIVTLHAYLEHDTKESIIAAVALCRVFCRLIARGSMVRRKTATDADTEVIRWLKDRLRDYTAELLSSGRWIGSPVATRESSALALIMKMVKEEVSQSAKRSEQAWRTGVFQSLISALLQNDAAGLARQEFVEKYADNHDDVRFFTFLHISQVQDAQSSNQLDILSKLHAMPEADDNVTLESWYGDTPVEGHQMLSLGAHRKQAQEAWLRVFRSAKLTSPERITMLNSLKHQILPWFTTRVELLADFLTDSFDEGGPLSLLALAGVFHLMTKRNLDYPDFYTKLYSLLDEEVLHSRHRSRFFRLLSTFLDSSHLPAAMVASFIKRLARLGLQAPPGAIVWIVPWVYNSLRAHPACTFMLHRSEHSAHAIWANSPDPTDTGMHDPFSMTEADPNITGAIESSLWELETLQSHYHPNVATLAKILSEQFTKRDYHLEDFLDHAYSTLLESELGRELKKAPEVEWEIPKRIVSSEGGLNNMGELLATAIHLQQ